MHRENSFLNRAQFPEAMVGCLYVGSGHEANVLPVDVHHHVDYDHYYEEVHYHRFGRGEEHLAS